MARRGVTLIETLAVVLLASLASVVGLGAIVSTRSPERRVDALLADIRDFDREVRLLARERGSVRLDFDGTWIEATHAHPSVDRLDMPMPRLRVLDGLSVSLVVGTEAEDTLWIDRSGRSKDVRWTASISGVRSTLAVAGLTGWSETIEAER